MGCLGIPFWFYVDGPSPGELTEWLERYGKQKDGLYTQVNKESGRPNNFTTSG